MPDTPPQEWNTPPPGAPADWPNSASFVQAPGYDAFGPVYGPPQMLPSPMPPGFEQTIGAPLPHSTFTRMASEATNDDTKNDVAYLTPIRNQYMADKQQLEQDRAAFARAADQLGFSAQFHAPSQTYYLNPKVPPANPQQAVQLQQNFTHLQQRKVALEQRMREMTQRGHEYNRLWHPVRDRINRRNQQGMQTYWELRQGHDRARMMPPPPVPNWDAVAEAAARQSSTDISGRSGRHGAQQGPSAQRPQRRSRSPQR